MLDTSEKSNQASEQNEKDESSQPTKEIVLENILRNLITSEEDKMLCIGIKKRRCSEEEEPEKKSEVENLKLLGPNDPVIFIKCLKFSFELVPYLEDRTLTLEIFRKKLRELFNNEEFDEFNFMTNLKLKLKYYLTQADDIFEEYFKIVNDESEEKKK